VAFDKERALASLKKSQVYGRTTGKVSAIQCCPSEAELRSKNAEKLSKLRLQTLEWCAEDNTIIFSIRFTLSDGTVSPQIGATKVNKSFEFPKDRPIITIKIRA